MLFEPTAADKASGNMLAYYPFDEPHMVHTDYSIDGYHFSYTVASPVNDVSPDYISVGEYENVYNVLQFSGAAPLLGPQLPMPVEAFNSKDVTVEMWIAFSSKTSATIPIVGVLNRPFNSGFEIGFNGPANTLWCHFSDAVDANPTIKAVVNIALNTWTHIACVDSFTLSKGQVFVDTIPLTNVSYYAFTPSKYIF